MKTVYLAGPIVNLDYNAATFWRNYSVEVLEDVGIRGLSPMRAKMFLKDVVSIDALASIDHPLSTDDGITSRDRNDVMSCDIVLANFLQATNKASCGTPIEFGWADAWRKPIVMVIEPSGNPFDHPMMRSIASF